MCVFGKRKNYYRQAFSDVRIRSLKFFTLLLFKNMAVGNE